MILNQIFGDLFQKFPAAVPVPAAVTALHLRVELCLRAQLLRESVEVEVGEFVGVGPLAPEVVDARELHEGGEHEGSAHPHPHVDRLNKEGWNHRNYILASSLYQGGGILDKEVRETRQTERGNTRGGTTKKRDISRTLFSINLHF